MRDRPFEFRTIAILYTLLGIVIALTIHFVVLSSARYNWLQQTTPSNNNTYVAPASAAWF